MPEGAAYLLVLGHGAGAGMLHKGMEAIAHALADHGIATFRYEFPYMREGRKLPDPKPVLLSTVRHAVVAARALAPDLPLLAGGKSMGGRMTSMAAAEEPLKDVQGIIFFGFPLHPAKQPGTSRAEHLANVGIPMLFLQGTRDALAELDLLTPICSGLPLATLEVAEGADHSFHVSKSSGRTDAQVLNRLAHRCREWADSLPAGAERKKTAV
jgi:uncharacterized protein